MVAHKIIKSQSFVHSLIAKIAASFGVIILILLIILLTTYIGSLKTEAKLNTMTSVIVPSFILATESAEKTLQLDAKIINTTNIENLSNLRNKILDIDATALDIENTYQKLHKLLLENTGASHETTALLKLSDSFTSVKTAIENIIATQEDYLALGKTLSETINNLDSQQTVLSPLLNDIAYELDDDYMISLIMELEASTNYGILIIEKIKNATDENDIASLQNELTQWILQHKSITKSMPISAGDNPENYRNLMASLDQVTTTILEIAQGQYNESTNRYINGLQSYKAEQIQLLTKQRENILQFKDQLQKTNQLSDDLIQLNISQVNIASERIQLNIIHQRWINIWAGIIALVVALLVSVYLTRHLRRAIKILSAKLTDLSEGKLTQTKQRQLTGEFGVLYNAVENVAHGLDSIVKNIRSSNSEMEHSVDLVSNQSEQTCDFVDEQKQALDILATALTELAASANEVASHSMNTLKEVTDVGTSSNQALSLVDQNKSLLAQLQKHSAQAQEIINALNIGVHSIENTVSTISSIAEQTNLLALNAAIEAARAGEQGRGFSVVADEVRALAKRTQAATDEVQTRTKVMFNEAELAVQAMNQSTDLVNKSATSAEEVGQAITLIDSAMLRILDLSHLIAIASEEQAATVNELNSTVTNISNLTEQTYTAAHASRVQSSQLHKLGEGLKVRISRFQL